MWIDDLKKHVEQKPIAILRLNEAIFSKILESWRGVSEFTIALSHHSFTNLKAPTVCLILDSSEKEHRIYLGIIGQRSAITTFQSRVKVKRIIAILPEAPDDLVGLLEKSFYQNALRTKLSSNTNITLLSPKLSSYLIERLAEVDANTQNLHLLAASLTEPKKFSSNLSLQTDAIHMALKVFGLSSTDLAKSLLLTPNRDTALASIPIIEDNVIEHDARIVPGYQLESSDLTGRAVFARGRERLEVFTANRRKLEEAFGVDLIYLNVTRQNIVMVQYKMLERPKSNLEDWVFTPDDQLEKEIDRMRNFSESYAPSQSYRFNPAVFYLKFVKRDGSIRNSGIILPIDHYDLLVQSEVALGPRGGLRISYNALNGCYMREQPFLNLIQSGYIGAHAETTDALMTLVTAVLERGRAAVAAIQTATNDEDSNSVSQEEPSDFIPF